MKLPTFSRRPDLEPRLCKLQINTAGAWRDICKFDCDAHGDAIQRLAPPLAELVGATLRICIADSLNSALMHWDAERGWRPA